MKSCLFTVTTTAVKNEDRNRILFFNQIQPLPSNNAAGTLHGSHHIARLVARSLVAVGAMGDLCVTRMGDVSVSTLLKLAMTGEVASIFRCAHEGIPCVKIEIDAITLALIWSLGRDLGDDFRAFARRTMTPQQLLSEMGDAAKIPPSPPEDSEEGKVLERIGNYVSALEHHAHLAPEANLENVFAWVPEIDDMTQALFKSSPRPPSAPPPPVPAAPLSPPRAHAFMFAVWAWTERGRWCVSRSAGNNPACVAMAPDLDAALSFLADATRMPLAGWFLLPHPDRAPSPDEQQALRAAIEKHGFRASAVPS